MSQVARVEISNLMKSTDVDDIEAGIKRLGDSVDKIFLMDRLRNLTKAEGL